MGNSRAMAAAIVGAVVGGVAGYLFFTDDGRRLRRQLEPALDDFARELNSFRSTINKAAGVASTEGSRESAPLPVGVTDWPQRLRAHREITEIIFSF